MILLIDNYDSFSYNLFQMLGELNPDIKIIRNDAMTIEEIKELKPSHIILSPGPGKPKDAGICEEVVRQLKGQIPILGVCLGHQAICEVYGATVTYAKKMMHGKQSVARIDNRAPIFAGLPEEIEVARYHSLAAKKETIKNTLEIIAVAEDEEVMAVCDRKNQVYGLQFHPESILTRNGKKMLMNFLKEKKDD